MSSPEPSLTRRAAAELETRLDRLADYHAVIGLDGFVDQIISVVDQRRSSTEYTRVPTIAAYADRIARAAGHSANIEVVVHRTKLGGNGPIMANALAVSGLTVDYIGNLGYPAIHQAFAEFATRATVHSIAEPGHTDALEFDDGKLMIGKHQGLKDVNWENLVARVGRQPLIDLFARAHLVGLQNWTMLTEMTDIWKHVLSEICPALPPQNCCRFFFDLADPEKRSAADIDEAVHTLARFQAHCETCLGLNEAEANRVAAVLGYNGPRNGQDAVKATAAFIHDQLKIAAVIVHPRAYAVAASTTGVVQVDGPFVQKPLISTGAGDHFNAGFCLGQLIGADHDIALQLAVATSGYYVRTAQSPTADDLTRFLREL
jgi:sugar/nucleoside kinase (ribokinase family)